MNLTAHIPVIGSAGEPVGTLIGISMNPATNQVCDLIVASPDQSMVMSVPVLSVVRIDEDEVELSIPAERCRDLAMTLIEQAPSSRPTAATRAKSIVQLPFGSAVHCSDGAAGLLRSVLYDQYSQDILDLVVGGKDLPHDVAVPIEWAGLINDRRIVLSCTRKDLQTLPLAPEDR